MIPQQSELMWPSPEKLFLTLKLMRGVRLAPLEQPLTLLLHSTD